MELFTSKIKFLIPLVIILISGMQKSFGQDTLHVELITNTTVDVCSQEKKLTIEVQTNEIYAKDSLQGYALIVEYDADKIQIDQVLTLNTLTNQIVSSGGEVYSKLLEPGVYRVDAFLPFNSNIFLKGKIPLLVFSGRYIGQCEGIASIRISDFEPVFYSFGSSKVLNYQTEKYINGEVSDIKGREFNITFVSQSIEISKGDSLKDTDVYLQYQFDSKITNANILLSVGMPELLSIEAIESLQSGITIDTLILRSDSTKFKVSLRQNFNTSLPALRLKLKSLKNDNFKSPIAANILETNKCNCVKTRNGDILEVVKIKLDTSISVGSLSEKKEKITFIQSDDILKLVSPDYLRKITLFNIVGHELQSNTLENPSYEYSLPLNMIPNGIYIIEVLTNAENKRNYIKFIK